jgi:hypothetical protein
VDGKVTIDTQKKYVRGQEVVRARELTIKSDLEDVAPVMMHSP